MNCPFCHQEMYFDGYVLGLNGECESYACHSISCLINQDFPRYKCQVNKANKIVREEYGLGTFYVRVYEEDSLVYQLKACMLFGELKIARQLFLNRTNLDQTLDKLKMLAIFS